MVVAAVWGLFLLACELRHLGIETPKLSGDGTASSFTPSDASPSISLASIPT